MGWWCWLLSSYGRYSHCECRLVRVIRTRRGSAPKATPTTAVGAGVGVSDGELEEEEDECGITIGSVENGGTLVKDCMSNTWLRSVEGEDGRIGLVGTAGDGMTADRASCITTASPSGTYDGESGLVSKCAQFDDGDKT